MPLDFTVTSTNSNLGTADVSIVASPASGVINTTNMVPGQTVQGMINVSNTGNIDEFYYVTAAWNGAAPTSDHKAALLAEYLNVSVTASPSTNIFTGKLSALVDQPASPGQALTLTTGNEDVIFSFNLPATVSPVLNNIDLSIDFVFVASS
ncbi:MAG TPA: hypothetical protein VN426_08195 [Syntrophomonadaceae bacterium]|nr:hypothetical protein [Syntrophomonadaceae bacterium]